MGKETFAFDPASNIINPNKTQHSNQGIHNHRQDTYYEPTHKHGYNSLVNNVVQDYINQKYQYDDYGQLIRQSDGGHVQDFAWDALGRLVRSKNDKAETYYRYDALGRRIEKSKQHIQAGRNHYTETTQYGWDGDTLAYESTNLYTKHYVYENGSFVPLIQATYRQQINQHQTPQWEHGYDYDKDPLWHTAQKAEKFDRVWFYHCDHLGTPQEMSDQTGAIVWTANYKAWGECKTENHTKRDIWDSEIITNNIRFQGQYYDDETGLHYNRHRYYSPYVGRFISKDPIGLLGGLNTFAYAPNPIQWIDPYGLNPKYNKPLNSPLIDKWIDKGGTVWQEVDTKTWVYKDWDGNVVRYPNGYPDFSSYVKQEVKIPNLKGNHSKSPTGDFGRADTLAPNGKADYSKNTWHHHEDKVTMQEMPKDIHNRFTHCGGVSGIKKG